MTTGEVVTLWYRLPNYYWEQKNIHILLIFGQLDV